MQFNYAIQNAGALTWDGTASHPVDVRGYNGYAFTFTVTADLAADAVINIQAAPAGSPDPCVPGTFADVPEVLTCVADWGAVPGPQSTITIPSGTKKGARCRAGIPCPVGAFVQAVPTAGGASLIGVVTLHGPQH